MEQMAWGNKVAGGGTGSAKAVQAELTAVQWCVQAVETQKVGRQ